MGSPPENPDLSSPPADIAGEPGHVQDDPAATEVVAKKKLEDQAENQPKEKEKKKKDGLQTLKKAIIVSGIVVAVAGIAFAVTKKLKEK